MNEKILTLLFRQVTVEETVSEYFQQDYRTMHIQNHTHTHTHKPWWQSH